MRRKDEKSKKMYVHLEFHLQEKAKLLESLHNIEHIHVHVHNVGFNGLIPRLYSALH